jgi:hypothetical protein
VRVYVNNCGVPESRCFPVGTTVSLTTAKSLSESQAILGRHHVVKHRVDCAGEKVETPCNIGNIGDSSLLTHETFTGTLSLFCEKIE